MFVKKEGFDSVSRRVLDLQTTSDLRNVQPQHPVSTTVSHRRCHFFQPQPHTRKSPKKIHPNQLVAHCYPLRDLIPT